jgi:hypothetical protein
VFYSGTSGDNLTWSSADEVLQITGTNGQTSLDVLDGDVRVVDTLYFYDRGGESMSSDGSTLTVAGTVVFSGDITVSGTTTTVDSTVVVIADPLFHVGNDNNADAVDLGIFGEYTDSGKKFAGLFRDASDSDKWKLFSRSGNSDEEPSTTVNTTSGFALADLAVNELEGTLTTAAQTNITSVGALDGGSITSNFGTIDTGASTITTTGLISGGSLDIDNVLINGTTIGHTDDTDLLTVANGILTLAGQLILDGDRSLTPGDGGAMHLDTHTVTDSNTSGSGTATKYTHVNIEAPTLAATNNSVTTTDAATLYVSGAVAAGTNETLTRTWAVWVDAGNVRYDASIYAGTTEALNSSGLVTVANQSNITGVGTIATGTWEGTTVAVDQGGTGATTLNNLITMGTHTTGNYVATITGGTGIDSNAATSGESTTHTLSVDLAEVGEVAIADGDYIAFMDATDSSATKKEALADVATLFAGTGLAAASSVLSVDLNEVAEVAIANGDYIAFMDATASSATKKEAIADVASLFAGTVTSTGLSASSSVLTIDIENMTASTTIADADLIVIDDGAGGTLRKMTRANFIESAALDAINIDGGAIDAVTIGTNSAVTQLVVDNMDFNGNTITATGDLTVVATTGQVVVNPAVSTTGGITQFQVRGDITTTDGTSNQRYIGAGGGFGGSVVINSGNTHGKVSTVELYEPNITETSGSVTVASTLYIGDAPTEGGSNYALLVDAGDTRFDGDVQVVDDIFLELGSDKDSKIIHSTGAISADAEVTDLIVGTSQHLVTAANSLIISNTTTDGDIAFFTSDGGNSIGTMVIKGAKGNVEFYNTVAGTQTLDIYNKGTAGANYMVIWNDVDSQVGSVSHDGSNTTAYNTTSDYRLKENAVTLSGAVTRVKTLKPYRFNFRASPSKTKDGFFAHEAATVVPESVTGAKDAVDSDNNPIVQGMDNSKLVPLLTAAIQELDARITALE